MDTLNLFFSAINGAVVDLCGCVCLLLVRFGRSGAPLTLPRGATKCPKVPTKCFSLGTRSRLEASIMAALEEITSNRVFVYSSLLGPAD